MQVPFRQGILSGQTDGLGHGNFLALTAGGYVDHVVSPISTYLNFAFKGTDYLLSVTTTKVNAWGPFTNNSETVYLYWDISLRDAQLTYGSTLSNPVYMAAAPMSPAVDTHWFDTGNKVMKVWNGASWIEKIRVFAGQVVNANTVIHQEFGSQVEIDTPVDSGYIMFDSQGLPIRTSAGYFFTSDTDAFMSVSGSTAIVRLDQNMLPLTADEAMPKYAVVAIAGSANSHMVLADPMNADKRAIGITEHAVAAGELSGTIFRGVVSHTNWSTITVEGFPVFPPTALGKQLWLAPSGQFTLLRPENQVAQCLGTVVSANSIYLDIDSETKPISILPSGVQSVQATAPLSSTGGADPVISITPATTTSSGYMSSADKIALDGVVTGLAAEISDRAAGDSARLALTGGTMTGTLVLAYDPINVLEASTKQYVDNTVSLATAPVAKTWFVSPSAVAGNGSLNKPFAFIADALMAASTNDIIHLLPGEYAEDLLLDKALTICGSNVGAFENTLITGQVTLAIGSHGLKHLSINNPRTTATDYAVRVNGSDYASFDDVRISRAAGGDVISYEGVGTAEHVYSKCSIRGNINMAQAVVRPVTIIGATDKPSISMVGVQTVNVVDTRGVTGINHLSGKLNLSNVTEIASLTSAATGVSNEIVAINSSFLKADGTFGVLTMQPTTLYTFADVVYDTVAATLGTRMAWGSTSNDIKELLAPTNYVAMDMSQHAHMVGIDGALGAKENAGTAASVLSGHLADLNPHPQYLSSAALAGKEDVGVAQGIMDAHTVAVNPHSQYANTTDVVMKAGSTMTGMLVLSADPVALMDAATKKYVDDSVAAVAPGTPLTSGDGVNSTQFAANVVEVLVDPADLEFIAGTDPTNGHIALKEKLPGGDGVTLYSRVAVNTKGQVVAASNGTLLADYGITDAATAEQGTAADSAVQRAGDTMTGDLVLAADPTLNMHASTKQYVDNSLLDKIRFVGAAPASSTDVGTAGDFFVDANFMYTCIATNTWVRVAVVSTF